MYVKFKPTGQVGTIDDNEFDPSIYEQVGGETQQPQTQQVPTSIPVQKQAEQNYSISKVPLLGFLTKTIAPKITQNVIDPAIRTVGMGGDYLNYLLAQTPEEKQRIAQEYTKKINEQEDWAGKVGFATQKTGGMDVGRLGKEILQGGLEGASIGLPAGKGIKAMTGMGALSGILRGTSEAETPSELLTKSLGGALGGGVAGATLGVAGKVISAGGSLLNKAKKSIGEKATQAISKATPSQWAIAAAEHGMDVNNLVRKYVPKGASYDDILGPVTERGTGGILKQSLDGAEETIQNTIKQAGPNMRIGADDVIAGLTDELKNIKKLPGNDANASALSEFIQQTKKLYKNGITAQKLLDIKRAADSKFGKAVVDEQTGSVAAQGQKMLANWSRKMLKKIFPEVEDALNTQTEVFTFRPILERARGTLNTQGSQIRRGAFDSLTDLLNPVAHLDSFMSRPENASRFMNMGIGAGSGAGINIPSALTKTSQLLGGILGTGFSTQNDKEYQAQNTYPNANQEQEGSNVQGQTDHPSTIAQSGEIGQDAEKAQRIKQAIDQLTQLQFVDMTQGGKNLAKLDVLKAALKEQLPTPTTEIGATALKNKLLAESGLRALTELEQIVSTDPQKVLLGAIPGQLGARDYDSAAFRAVEGLLRARSGAAVPETEVRRYMRANLPRLGDTENDIQKKLFAFRKDLEAVAQTGGGASIEQSLSDLLGK